MKKCQNCGKNNVNNAKYCMDCGTLIDHKVTFHTKHYIEFLLMALAVILVFTWEAPSFFALIGIITAGIMNYYPKIGAIIAFITSFFLIYGFYALSPGFFFFIAGVVCFLHE